MKLSFPQLLPAIVVILSSGPVQAQWQRQYPLDKLENVLDIDVHDDGYGFAVGTNDLILRLDESTQTWDLLDGYGAAWRLEAVDYLNGSSGNVAAAGGDGLILTTDKGDNWNEIPGAPAGIHTLKLFSPTHIMVISDGGAYEWEDEIWTDMAVPALVGIKGGFILDYDHIWAFTFATNPAIYYSSNAGQTWDTNLDISDIDIVRFYDEMQGVATDGRKVYTTTDGGVEWNLISTNAIHNSSNDITFGSSVNVLMAATLNADPAISTNGGLNWTQLSTDQISDRSYSIASLSDNEFWLGNDLTSLLYSSNAGSTWEERSGPERNLINDVFFINRMLGFGLGQDGMLVRTTDGGDNWNDISFGIRNHLAMHGSTPDDLWMGANQRILHSVDQGDTWTVKLSLPGGNVNDIFAISHQRVIAAITSGVILLTSDSGVNWDTVYNAGALLKSIAKIDEQRYMVTGFNGTILRSEDQGQTWTPLTSPDATLQYEQSYFLDGTGWLVTSSFKNQMWSTHDHGDTWIPINLPIDRFWDGVYFMSQDTGIIVGRSSTEGRVYITYNGGANWSPAYITSFPFYGVTGFENPNGTAWIYGVGSNIEALTYCNSIPGIHDLEGDAFPCQQDTIPFSVSGSNIDFYHWSLPPGWTLLGPDDSNVIQVVVGTNSGFISVTGSNDCGETSPLSLSTSADPLPSIFELQGDQEPCVGELIIYNAINLEVDDFEWAYPSGWSIIGDKDEGFLSMVAGDVGGVISVIGTNSCGSTQEVFINVTPFIPPIVDATYDGVTLSLSEDGLFYQWYLDGEEIIGATGATCIPTESGLYSASITFPSQCATTSTVVEVIITAIPDVHHAKINVFPDPAFDKIFVQDIPYGFGYRILDLSGKLITKSISYDASISVSQLMKGMYLLSIQSENKNYISKFIRG